MRGQLVLKTMITLAVLILLGLALMGQLRATKDEQTTSVIRSSPDANIAEQTPTLNPDLRFVQQVERDAILAIDDPQFLDPDQATNDYAVHDLVIGIEINGDARAYSIALLSRHEIVNDVVGGQPIVVTWCPLCFNAAIFDREVDGQILDFGVSGLLLNNLLVMYDRQTDSLWTPFDGTALQGPLMGVMLERIHSSLTIWEAWREQFPHTLALDTNSITVDVYESYYNNADSGVTQGFDFDERLPTKSFVIGVSFEDQAIAYPFLTLAREYAVNDTVGNKAIIVVFLPESQTALVYDRAVNEQTLTFTFDPETQQLTDDQTHSTWDACQGLAIEGEFEGQILRRVHSTRMFWFAWRDHQPHTHIYGQ